MDTVALLTHMGIAVGHAFSIGLPVHQARNKLAEAFLASRFEYLFMIDADMSWNASDVLRFVQAGYPLLAGVGRKRNSRPDSDPEAWCFSPIDPTTIPVDGNGFCEVAQVGTGFICIHRSVFERLRDAHPEWNRRKRDGGHYTAFFRWEVEGEDEISEDIRFCRDWRAIGGKVMVDPSVTLHHYGNHDYVANMKTLFCRQY